MKTKWLIIVGFLLLSSSLFSQSSSQWNQWNPAAAPGHFLFGQAWPDSPRSFFNRLPASAEGKLRKAVWDLSTNSAGLQIRFQTNAKEIQIKYIVKAERQMPHMPATGVSGLDVYGRTKNGKWVWAAGKFRFGDTCLANFKLNPSAENIDTSTVFTLYLPLYNTVSWLNIQYPTDAIFKPIEIDSQKPIVVYGTSITQGACASRPGLAWTNQLGRAINENIINLGFSGNGRLEKELLEMISTIDSKLYVFDCLPNLVKGYVSNDELKLRIANTIEFFHQKRAVVPLLFTEHDGYSDEDINAERQMEVDLVNRTLNEVVHAYQMKGYQGLYIISKSEIGQNIESSVDGTHPNDYGMLLYALAYQKAIKKILDPY